MSTLSVTFKDNGSDLLITVFQKNFYSIMVEFVFAVKEVNQHVNPIFHLSKNIALPDLNKVSNELLDR